MVAAPVTQEEQDAEADVESCVNLLTQNKPGPRPSDNK